VTPTTSNERESLLLASWRGWLAWDLRVLSLNPLSAELTPGGVDSACHLFEVGEMSTSLLVWGHSISGMVAPQ